MPSLAEEEDRTVAQEPGVTPKKRHNVEELEGERIADRYIVTKRIGKGGMGVVYLAEHVTLKRNVCIKVLNPALIDDESAVERFEREARSLSRLQHPNIVTIFDFGRDDDLAYIVMEYAQGETLSKFLKRNGPLNCDTFLPIAVQILKGIGEAHKLNMIHRDIKPANIILSELEGEKNFVKILDFGLAKLAQGQEDVTKEQQLVGSASYMAPEQILKGQSDSRTDVYALGIMFYQMLAGTKPFVGQNDNIILYKHVNETPEQLNTRLKPEQEIPDTLCAVIMQAMSKDASKRPQDALSFLNAISIALDAPQLRAGYSSMSLGKVDLQKLSEEADTHCMGAQSGPVDNDVSHPSSVSGQSGRVSLNSLSGVSGVSGVSGITGQPLQSGQFVGLDNTNTYSGVTNPSGVQYIPGNTLIQAADVLEVMARQDRNKDKRFFVMIFSILVIVGVLIVVFIVVNKKANDEKPATPTIVVNQTDTQSYFQKIEQNIANGDIQTASVLLTTLKSDPNRPRNVETDERIARLDIQLQVADLLIRAERQVDSGNREEARKLYQNVLDLDAGNVKAQEALRQIKEDLNRVGSVTFDFYPDSDIQVYIDHELRGTIPGTLDLPPGSHTVRVTADGYNELNQDFTIKAGESLTLSLKLDKKASDKPRTSGSSGGSGSSGDSGGLLLNGGKKKSGKSGSKTKKSGGLLL